MDDRSRPSSLRLIGFSRQVRREAQYPRLPHVLMVDGRDAEHMLWIRYREIKKENYAFSGVRMPVVTIAHLHSTGTFDGKLLYATHYSAVAFHHRELGIDAVIDSGQEFFDFPETRGCLGDLQGGSVP